MNYLRKEFDLFMVRIATKNIASKIVMNIFQIVWEELLLV